MSEQAGRFLVIEGLEGAGKSTAMTVVKRFLADKVPEIITTREPGGTHVGEAVRALIKETHPSEVLDARAELLLMYASRVQLVENVIKPALKRGSWVLADRFELSTYAYQGGGRQLDSEMIAHLSHFCLPHFKPDLILFLDVSPEKGLRRARRRGKIDRIEQESLSFFEQVHRAYHAQIKHMDNVVLIDANQPLPMMQNAIYTSLKHYMKDYVPTT